MYVFPEPLGGFREPTEEDVYRLVDLVVELIGDRGVEEAIKQSAVLTPSIPVMHPGERPRAS